MTMNEEIKQLLNEVDTLKIQLSALRPLPEEALKKIQDALDIEYTYESNRIEGNTLTLQETALVVNEGVTILDRFTLFIPILSASSVMVMPFSFITSFILKSIS